MILAGLAIFAGLSLNLIFQFALGAAPAGKGSVIPLFQIICLFISVLILYIVFTYIINFFSWEFMGYFLFFPVCALVCLGLECLERKLFPKKKEVRLFSGLSAYEGLVPASLILTMYLALNLLDALILSLSFALGCFMAVFIMKEIRRRSSMEGIPKYLRGMPLALISMGLLSMIFSSAAWIFFRVLEGR